MKTRRTRLLLAAIVVLAAATTLLLNSAPRVVPTGETLAPSPAAAKEKLVFVYLHGFGGAREDPPFYENMKAFLAGVNYDCEALNYEWDSVRVQPTKAGANWDQAEQNADKEAAHFKTNILDRLESEKTPYVLIGFSIGSRVILRALEDTGGSLRMLRGIWFLGSAMTSDTTIDPRCLPKGMKISNYHSPKWDYVHKTAFNFMKGIPAGGKTGFKDHRIFSNYAVSCSHAHKGIGIHVDYSQLAPAIGYIALLKERVFVPGDASFNIPSSVGEGSTWWNKILRIDTKLRGRPCTLEIEQFNANKDYFRAVAIYRNGKRRRVARGDNIHAILDSLGIIPPSYWRNKQ